MAGTAPTEPMARVGFEDGAAAARRGELLRVFAAEASIEVTPARIRGGGLALATLLPAATRVAVPLLPRADHAGTVEACRLLVAAGMRPLPHVAARALPSVAALRRLLADLAEARVDSLMLIAGDRGTAAGPFRDSLAVLESGLLIEHGFRRLAVGAYPEGHPTVPRQALERSLERKADYAATTGTRVEVITQFAFAAEPVTAWLSALGAAGFPLPVRVGVPGPATLRTLTAYAARCGISASARLLRRRPDAARLLASWAPDGLVRELARHRTAAAASPLCGIHVFAFGSLARSVGWLRRLRGDAQEHGDVQVGGADGGARRPERRLVQEDLGR